MGTMNRIGGFRVKAMQGWQKKEDFLFLKQA